MATLSSVFTETLHEITTIKLDELSKRRAAFDATKSAVLSCIENIVDPIKRVRTLSDGVKKCFSIMTDKGGKVVKDQTKHQRLETEIKNLDRFLAQADNDPSVSAEMIGSWERSLRRHLDMLSLKYQYASLYGELVTERLADGKGAEEVFRGDVEMGEAFEDVGNATKLEARMEWEETVFKSADIDVEVLSKYLGWLFGVGSKNPEKEKVLDALKELRDGVGKFESELARPSQFTNQTLDWVINGLLASGLLPDEKQQVLKDFLGNPTILTEIAHVLNMRLNALDSWSWGAAGVPVEQRRKISGVYNMDMHEDILQAIFLQYIGVKWSIFIKEALKEFRGYKGAWKSMRPDIPSLDRKRLEYYLGDIPRGPCIQTARQSLHRKNFMCHLPDHEWEQADIAEGEEAAEFEEFAAAQPEASKCARKSAPSFIGRSTKALIARGAVRHRRIIQEKDWDDENPGWDEEDYDEDAPKTPMQRQQRLLHLLSAEIAINTRLHGEITAFHSVFADWDQLLPHETILTLMRFLGVSDTWQAFFARFLAAPLKFVEDDASTPARTRRRGTPSLHALSDFFGETVLFCLDFAVNQTTAGKPLWRIHDDIWFWASDHAVAVKAWKTVSDFAQVTGTSVNAGKTGTVRIALDPDASPAIDASLPRGQIRWGFLQLCPRTGRFEIDQTMVDAHITELRKQLLRNKRLSILGFVQIWNSYAATFFTANFGRPANCFGRSHVDSILATHARIQRKTFAGANEAGSVVQHLKDQLALRFGIADVPDGYVFLPAELGGLALRAPSIPALLIRDAVLGDAEEPFEELRRSERDAYAAAKAAFFHAGEGAAARQGSKRAPPEGDRDDPEEIFMGFEEFVRWREEFEFEEHDMQVHDVFRVLMERPTEESVEENGGKVLSALGGLEGIGGGIAKSWRTLEPYWKWIAMMYGPEIVDRFGGLDIVDPGLLPMGMMSLVRDKRVTWQG
ncbi:hypothetical protein QBC33DRAFT_598519 [Phialemonium atrogriseum]|uniref:Reverse transcriptase domain-containing protein n=1 Tax=Phialemonium atrogriseum TaxID=1093897 RepID=A0AAJ0BTX5_9PEZI|nr:uncharacterized protein QBC33DRAFT_598519 [Phialemonium atrogriseum]KAK1763338.1 hypothetical protein QBC33DRAFT_598519 [Phialemonium atrogriseum]